MNKQKNPSDTSTPGLYNFSLPSLLFIVVLLFLAQPAFSMVQINDPEPDCKTLIKAIEQKDYPKIQELLSSIDPNCTVQDPERKISKSNNKRKLFFQSARSPLVASARIADLKTGMMLVKAGADVQFHALKDETPLIAASASGNIHYVEFLISRGAQINRVVTGEGTALIAASKAGNIKIVQLLILHGAEVGQMVVAEGTPLINAIRSGHYEVSKILLENGADPLLSTSADEDPIYHARRQKDKRFLELLKEQHQENVINPASKGKGASTEKEKFKIWLHNLVDSTMQVHNIPALSVGIVWDEKIYYADGFGFLERENDKEVTEQSLYQIGSSTKQFTGIIIRNLIAEGKLNIEDKMINYFPDSTLTSEAKENLKDITIKDLLLHRSGLPGRAPGNKRIDGDPMLIPYREQDLVKDLNQLELDFQPNTEFSYSNLGYAVLGFLAELSSGEDYSSLIEKYISNKYNLQNTFIHPDLEHLPFIVTPYRKDDRDVKSAPWKMGKMAPAGGVYSNISDLSKLMIRQIGVYKEFKSIGNTDNPLILTDQYSEEGSHYGFGLVKNVDEVTGTRYGHGGDLDGYASSYVFSPEKRKGFILLTSSGGSWIGILEKQIRKRMNF